MQNHKLEDIDGLLQQAFEMGEDIDEGVYDVARFKA